MLTNEVEEWTEEEIEKQKHNTTSPNRKKTVEQNINTKIEKKNEIKKIISDLFCSHKKVVRKGNYIICTKCGYKWKANYNVGTSK